LNYQSAIFSGDVVTINALIRGHIESGDFNSALNLIDEHILLDKSKDPLVSQGGSKKYKADRFTTLEILRIFPHASCTVAAKAVHRYRLVVQDLTWTFLTIRSMETNSTFTIQNT
jgi:pentatricopeptide repeat protein